MHLERIRKLCLALPNAEEVHPFSAQDSFWRTNGNWFASHGEWKGDWLLSVRVEPGLKDVFLDDPRFLKTPYLGRNNWVSLKLDPKPDWREIKALLGSSHEIAAAMPKRKASKT